MRLDHLLSRETSRRRRVGERSHIEAITHQGGLRPPGPLKPAGHLDSRIAKQVKIFDDSLDRSDDTYTQDQRGMQHLPGAIQRVLDLKYMLVYTLYIGKIPRAHGGCLGMGSRRRTRQAAIHCGERQARTDPQVSEWENPAWAMPRNPHPNTYGGRRQPGELKHLSTQRRGSQKRPRE